MLSNLSSKRVEFGMFQGKPFEYSSVLLANLEIVSHDAKTHLELDPYETRIYQMK